MVQKSNKVQPKHGKVTKIMRGASRNYRYVWDVSDDRAGTNVTGGMTAVVVRDSLK